MSETLTLAFELVFRGFDAAVGLAFINTEVMEAAVTAGRLVAVRVLVAKNNAGFLDRTLRKLMPCASAVAMNARSRERSDQRYMLAEWCKEFCAAL